MMAYKDAYHARLAIDDALGWLRDEDGWTRDNLTDLVQDAVDTLYEDEDEGAET